MLTARPPDVIQVLDFDGLPAYPALPYAHGWTNLNGGLPAQAAEQQQRFDVRACKCASPDDEARMLAVMESTGAGFDSFNSFMHNLLLHTHRPPTALPHHRPPPALNGPHWTGLGRAAGQAIAAGRPRAPFGQRFGPLSASVSPIDAQC